MSSPQVRTRLSKLALGAGFAALAVAVVTAHRNPATGYELSLFTGTPTLYFVGLAVALGISVLLSFVAVQSRTVRDGAFLLGTLSVTSVVMLPVIRGYYLFVGGDSLTHLGWTKELLWGQLEPTGLLYPGVHTMTLFISEVTGIRLGLSQMYVVLAFVLVYVLFVTLCVRLLASNRWAVPIGLFSALLVLPINNVSVHMQAHPVTQSLLFLPFALFLVLKYVVRDGEWMNPFGTITQNGLLLALASVALILVHPQGALNLILILFAVACVQFFHRRFRSDGAIAGHRPVYLPTGVAIVAFLAWAPRYPRVREAFAGVVNRLLAGDTPADEVTQRAGSLTEIGGSISGLFVKLFLVAFVFCLLAGLLALAWYSGRLDDRLPARNALLTYAITALVPLVVAFFLFFVASSNTQHFRYVGFIMAVATILGALAISEGATALTERLPSKTVAVCLVVCFLLVLPLPLATLHSTPFIHKGTSDLTEMSYDGANVTFEQMDRDVPFAGIRSGPRRLVHAIYGTVGAPETGIQGLGVSNAIPEPVFNRNLTTYYDDPRYIPISRATYEEEVHLYDGFRFSRQGFERLDASPAIDRVQTTGEYQLYLLDNETG